MNLKECIADFSGLLVIGDLHGEIDSLMRAITYAKKHALLLVSLGDLVDRGPFPFETLSKMLEVIESGEGVFVRGNHDNKHYRNAIGNNVRFSLDAMQTLESVGTGRMLEYLNKYVTLYEHPSSSYYHYIDNWIFAHGASHTKMWEYPDTLSNAVRSMALYGEVTGKQDAEGRPERIYSWIDRIPEGQCVIVGHDRKAIYDIKLKSPLLVTSKVTGGVAIFADTGCGKGGVLSGVVLKLSSEGPVLDKFVQFDTD